LETIIIFLGFGSFVADAQCRRRTVSHYHGLCQSPWQSSTSTTSIQTQILWNQESNIKLDLCLFMKPYTNSGSGWRVIRYCSLHFWCPSGNSSRRRRIFD
jgi:hypothetical protein